VLEEGFVEASRGPIIDVFDGGVGVAKPGVPEPVCEAAVVAFGLFAVEQEGQPFGVCQFVGLGIIAEFDEGAGHAVELELLELVKCGVLEHGLTSMEVFGAADVVMIDRRAVGGRLG
jgi:hypothetical protein